MPSGNDETLALNQPISKMMLTLPWLLLLAVIGFMLRWKNQLLQQSIGAADPIFIPQSEIAADWPEDAQLLAAALAEKLRCQAAAVVCPDLETCLIEHGVPTKLALQAAQIFEQLIASRYGGPGQAPATDDVADVVNQIRSLPSQT